MFVFGPGFIDETSLPGFRLGCFSRPFVRALATSGRFCSAARRILWDGPPLFRQRRLTGQRGKGGFQCRSRSGHRPGKEQLQRCWFGRQRESGLAATLQRDGVVNWLWGSGVRECEWRRAAELTISAELVTKATGFG